MARIGINAWFCGALNAIFNLLGISETIFEITQKELPTSNHDETNTDVGRFTFTESPVFMLSTTILLLQLTAIAIYLLGLQPSASPTSAGGGGCGLGEIFCSTYLIVCYWPFLKGLFGKGNYGIPLPTVCKSALLALAFAHLSRSVTVAWITIIWFGWDPLLSVLQAIKQWTFFSYYYIDWHRWEGKVMKKKKYWQ